MSTTATSQSLDSITDRLARLEESVANVRARMATAADIDGVKNLIAEAKTLIAEKEAVQTRWLLGIMTAASVCVAVVVIRTFIG